MTILAGTTKIERLINRFRARHALGAELLRQDDRMLADMGLVRGDLSREIGSWQERAEYVEPEHQRARAAIGAAPSFRRGLAGWTLPTAAVREALMLRRAA